MDEAVSPDVSSANDTLRRAVTAIVPCYNAGERVGPVIEALLRHVNHVVVVDDGSTDGATASLSGLGAEVVTFPVNRGKGFAMLEGFRAALADPTMAYAAIVDADGQHDASELLGLYEAALREKADLVIGSRTFDLSQVPWTSRFGNKMTARITRMMLGRDIPDTQSGYRLHSRRLLEHIVAHVPGGRYETEMAILVAALRKKFVVVPAPIQTIYEEGNRSSHFNKVRDSYRIYRMLLKSWLR
ncbi:MAG: glycosyltransferase family 2 protein [Candidatus Hydrogenedentes bacterium]|nr:glycosyltransferase family 2 protein [Candidatus Hydrogenedentota bacterium]